MIKTVSIVWRWTSFHYGDKKCFYDLKDAVSPFDVDDYFEKMTTETIVYHLTRKGISEEEFKRLRVKKFIFDGHINYVDIDNFDKGVKDFENDKRSKIIFLENTEITQTFWDYLTKELKLEHVYRSLC